MAENQESGAAAYSRSAIAAAVSAALAGPSAFAQTQGDAIEEIVVTATKREESLADIPMSIRAFTTDDIVRQGLEGLDDYVGKIPSLALARREPAGNSVVFRGVAASGIQFGTNPSSGIYLDEQPITAAGLNPDPRLVDIQRVGAERSAGHAVRRCLPVGHAAHHHQQAGPDRLRRLGGTGSQPDYRR